MAILALLLAAGCTGATPTPEASTPEATELTPPGAAPVAETQQPIPAAVTSTPVTPTQAPPTPTPFPPATTAPPPTPAPVVMALPSIADIVEKVRPAVVSILAEIGPDRFGRSQFGSGTGVIVDPQGLVLTNNHVIEGATTITVTMDDGSQVEAQVVGADRLSDLAVLRIPGGDFTVLPINRNIRPRPGEWVIAIGNALALPGGPTVTVGVVSAVGRTIEAGQGVTLYDLIQTDTVINPGNSGGPLISLDGQLVGINTSVLRGSTGSGIPIEGIGFAINMETAAQVSQQLIEVGRVQWAYMGLDLADLIPEQAAAMGVREGVVVARVVIDGPSDRAGIISGDIILSIDGVKIATLDDLIRLLRQELIAGQEVAVEVFRQGSTGMLQLVLGERPVR
ncbi:MAG: trypsin-like peptidase domain-containing protein [Chloroflexi bacterium]|nr:trypsin-like peptidase domain-containing protein [Chloroflexota bacterium]